MTAHDDNYSLPMTWDQRTNTVRPMTPDEITAAKARAKMMLDGDREWRREQGLEGNYNGGMCELCNVEPYTRRTLCENCYRTEKRRGYLDDYASLDFIQNPETHIDWAWKYFPGVVADLAHANGYEIKKIPGWLPKGAGRPSDSAELDAWRNMEQGQ